MYGFVVSHRKTQNDPFGKIDGTPVFPFRWGELLDERLDEAYVNLIGSRTPCFKPTEEIEVAIYEDGERRSAEYYVIARDDAERYPVWSDTYKHTLYLLERTKLLEGIICPALTFTNALGINNERNIGKIPAYCEEGAEHGFEYAGITTPAWDKTALSVPSAREVGMAWCAFYSKKYESYHRLKNYADEHGELQSQCKIIADGALLATVTKGDARKITPSELTNVTNIRLVYTVVVFNSENYYSTDTLTFEISVISNLYPLRHITVGDVVDRILRCAEPLSYGGSPRFLNGMSQSMKSVCAPEFSLAQGTLREQLKVVGSFIHAEPWLDPSDIVYFKPYGDDKRSTLEGTPFVYEGLKRDINEYCTSIHSSAQSLVSSEGSDSGTVTEPSGNLFKTLRSKTAYARIDEQTGAVKLREGVLSVRKCECGLSSLNDGAMYDITKYVFEATEYGANLTAYDRGYPYSKSHAIYYTIGGSTIDGIFYKAPVLLATGLTFSVSNILAECAGQEVDGIQKKIETAPEGLRFRVEYVPIASQPVVHGKQLYSPDGHDFVRPYNQSENMIESQWYGESLKGIAARLGNTEVERTYLLDGPDGLPEIGQMLDGCAISAVNTELMPGYLRCTVELTRDFNRISEYVGVSSVKRMYEISERQVSRRDIVIRNNLVIGKTPSGEINKENAAFTDYIVYSIIPKSSPNGALTSAEPGARDCKIELARVVTYGYGSTGVGDIVEYGDNLFPVVARSFGNSVSLSFSFKDNFSAGDASTYVEYGTDNEKITGYWNTDAPYTDRYGRVSSAKITLYPASQLAGLSSDARSDLSEGFPVADKYGAAVAELDDLSPYVSFRHLLDKDNREIPSYTFVLEAKTTEEDVIVGSGIARVNGYVTGAAPNELCVYLCKRPINKFDGRIMTDDTDSFVKCGRIIVGGTKNGYYHLGYEPAELPAFPSGGTEYGWIIATPTEETVESVINEYGEVTEAVVHKGGDVILSRRCGISTEAELEGSIEELALYVTSK